jgi:hypothetical protein
LILIDNDGNVSLIDENIAEEKAEERIEEDIDYIMIEAWQWIILIIGIIFVFMIITSSLRNVSY